MKTFHTRKQPIFLPCLSLFLLLHGNCIPIGGSAPQWTPEASTSDSTSESSTTSDLSSSTNEGSDSETGNPNNSCPQAVEDRYVVMAGEIFKITDAKQGLVVNDQDVDGDVLTVSSFSATSQQGGEVHVNDDGTFTFTPADKFWGGDEFTYILSDGQGCEVEGKVWVSVHPRTIALKDVAEEHGGFALDGEAPGDAAGFSVSGAGDVNGDSFADFIIAAPWASPNNNSSAGRSYVVFGGPVLQSRSLSTITQNIGGFALDGEVADDHSGTSVHGAGDVNGDGFAEIIIGAEDADPNNKIFSGRSYVAFGGSTLKSLPLAQLAQNIGGSVIDGEFEWDRSGKVVSSAGDINSDGFADLVIGASDASPNDQSNAGRSYAIFGNKQLNNIELTDITAGIGGFALDGEAAGDGSGISVSNAGDVNNDGFLDFIIGASEADSKGENSGRSYVIFGGPTFQSLSLSNIVNESGGFSIEGQFESSRSGFSVSTAGDANGDGFADLIIGAPGDPFNNVSGRSYVVFGGLALQSLSLSNVANDKGGFIFVNDDSSGVSVSSAGDINGDGFTDLIIGAPGNYFVNDVSGRSYVVFGGPALQSTLLTDIANGQGGFALDGEMMKDGAGISASGAGDINGDSFDDLIIGAPGANPNGDNSGRTYVIYGGDFTGSVTFRPTPANDLFEGTPVAESLLGGIGNDELIGNGGADVLYGGQGDDILSIADPGFFRIDGGTGKDTLRLDGIAMHLDLSKIPELAVKNIEVIDLNGANNELTLEVRDIVASSETSNTLIIEGEANNIIHANFKDTGFSYSGSIPGNYVEYVSSNEALRLWIAQGITRDITID